jgi:hypothetical protein
MRFNPFGATLIPLRRHLVFAGFGLSLVSIQAQTDVNLVDVPNYSWHAGCFGTACANLMGYWDRHGLPDFYTGPTAGGVAPLNSCGSNIGILSMTASRAGFDGRPADKMGHMDDYWTKYDVILCGEAASPSSYESTLPDPYVVQGRPEHTWDCIGDFIGLSQKKWTNMNGECDGNIDAYSFVYWDVKGNKRTNFTPTAQAGLPAVDIQSGLKAWAKYRGYDADVFTQLTEFNTNTPAGKGFTFDDLKAEIDAGYPVLLFLQDFAANSRPLLGMSRANPLIHGMLAYGYAIAETGERLVRYRTSWGSQASLEVSYWDGNPWKAGLPVRGVIGFHPLPKITSIRLDNGNVTVQWDGPSAQLYDRVAVTTNELHWYEVQKATSLTPPNFVSVTPATTQRSATIENCCGATAFFRVRIVPR